jgi:hypothetical protein
MTQLHFVKKARKADKKNGIKKGDSYYWWKFNFGSLYKSKTAPKRSQLTQSSFLATLWDLQDNTCFDREDFEGSVSNLIAEIEVLRDECQEKLDNMPEQLQESSSSAETLRERIDALDNWISDLNGVDLCIDDDLKDDEREIRIDEIMEELESIGCDL